MSFKVFYISDVVKNKSCPLRKKHLELADFHVLNSYLMFLILRQPMFSISGLTEESH